MEAMINSAQEMAARVFAAQNTRAQLKARLQYFQGQMALYPNCEQAFEAVKTLALAWLYQLEWELEKQKWRNYKV